MEEMTLLVDEVHAYAQKSTPLACTLCDGDRRFDVLHDIHVNAQLDAVRSWVLSDQQTRH